MEQTGLKTSHAATISPRRAFPRKTGSANRHDYLIVFANGVELEVTNTRNAGHARSTAIDYMRKQRRDNGAIVRTEMLPFDPRRHQVRLEEARA